MHLKLLFSLILKHGYVPDDFGKGVLIPLVKDKAGDLSSVDNYRPITISPTLSKVFDHVMLAVFGNYIISDELRFGF